MHRTRPARETAARGSGTARGLALRQSGAARVFQGSNSLASGGHWTVNRVPVSTSDGAVVCTIFG